MKKYRVLFVFLSLFLIGMYAFGAEDCGNGADDDGDGLIDCEDPDCYFTNASCECIQSTVIWAITSSKELVWFNPITGEEKKLANYSNTITDLAWSDNGILYGTGFNGEIYAINPNTGVQTLVIDLPISGNTSGLCSDQNGNLYIGTRSGNTRVYQYNIASNSTTATYNISPNECSGDLAFKDGFLYISTPTFKLVKLDISNGSFTTVNITGVGSSNEVFGLTSDADGNFYISVGKKIYSLNPNTGATSLLHTSNFSGSEFYGLSIISDNCQVVCNLDVDIINTDTTFCENGSFTINTTIPAGSDPYSGTYSWTTPTGNIIGTNSINTTNVGQFIVSISSGTCTAKDTIVITKKLLPNPNLGADKEICPGQTTLLQVQNVEANTTYAWNNGTTGTQFTANTTGTYWVDATNSCGTKRDTILVNPKAVCPCNLAVNITNTTTSFCENANFTINTTIPSGSDPYSGAYNWTTPSGSIVGTSSLSTSTEGQYIVSITAGSCTAKDTIVLSKILLPKPNLGADKELCPNETVLLQVQNVEANTTYAWNNGTTGTQFTANTTGTYWVVATNNCGTNQDTILVNPKAVCPCNLAVNITNTTTSFCENASFTINTTIPPGSDPYSGAYNWTTPSGSIVGTSSLSTSNEGQYIVSITDGSCTAKDTIVLSKILLPKPNLGADKELCPNETVLLQVQNVEANTNYVWNNGTTGTTISVNAAGTYWINATNSCGSKRDTLLIKEKNCATCNLEVSINGSLVVCPGVNNVLQGVYSGGHGAVIIQWVNPDNDTINGQSIINTNQEGSYQWMVKDSLCVKTAAVYVVELPLASVQLPIDTALCPGEMISIRPLDYSIANLYTWSDGDFLIPRTLTKPGTYILSAKNECNTAKDTIIIGEKEQCPCLVDLSNVFTPNNDQINDTWGVLSVCKLTGVLRIFNRWGEIVFETNDLRSRWDGVYKGVNAPLDVYLYHVEGIDEHGFAFERKGNLTLIR
ncbi:MAG: gliding motility-associated C-terminal domain-containing protein [Chitinophagales bacterium]|nr:gliding motility-associated C-terminal domain-containing protein [Chitinophagales bacterium]